MIFGQTCLHCGNTCEPLLIEVGAVLSISCGHCMKHIRYGQRYEYPDLDRIKSAIWDLTLHQMECIKMLFNGKTYPRAHYWMVYRILVNNLKKDFDRITNRITFVTSFTS